MRRILRPSLSRRLALLTLLVTVPPLLVGHLVLTDLASDYFVDAAKSKLETTASSLVDGIDGWAEDVSDDLVYFCREADVVSMDPLSLRAALRLILATHPKISYAHIIGPDGINVARGDDLPLKDFHDRAYFQRVMAGAPLVRETLLKARSSGHPALNHAAPINGPDGTVLGVVVFGVDLRRLCDVVDPACYGRTGYSFVINEEGRALAHPHFKNDTEPRDMTGLPPVRDIIRERASRASRFQDAQGVWWLAHAVPASNGWSVISLQQEVEVLADAHRVLVLGLLVMAATALIVGVLTALVTARTIRPIALMTATANRIAHGDRTERMPATRADELGTLALAFNRTLDELDQAYHSVEVRVEQRTEEFSGANRLLQTEIEARKRTEANLERARAQAEAATRSKSEFLANMSHEIRTPMTAILGYAETLTSEHLSPAERHEAVHTIMRNGECLIGIINDILDLSKIEAGRLTIERVAFSPCQLLAEVESLLRVRTTGKGLRLELEFEGSIPETIQSDPLRLRQILINVVGNAIKFTEVGGVRLVARLLASAEAASLLQFDVVDSGLGMTVEQAARIFEPFLQADASTTRTHGGTGLGLAISKRLANALGGDLQLAETKPGYGSRFRITIGTGPLDGVALLADPRAATTVVDTTKPTTGHGDAPVQLCGRVLLVEDGPDNRRLIAHVLRKAGATVSVAENGERAVEAALAARDGGCPFDVILMDMQMPVMDGYTATRRLRALGYTRPIIALTANAMSDDRQKCLDAGCNDFATKPLQRLALLRQVSEWMQRARSSAEPQPVAAGS